MKKTAWEKFLIQRQKYIDGFNRKVAEREEQKNANLKKMSCVKDGRFLTWGINGKTFKWDISTGETSCNEVSVDLFFFNMTAPEVINLIPDEKYKKFLLKFSPSERWDDLYRFMRNIVQFHEAEKFFQYGVNISGATEIPFSRVSKHILRYLKHSQVDLDNYSVTTALETHTLELTEKMCSYLYFNYEFDFRGYEFMRGYLEDYNVARNLQTLVSERNYEYKRLFDYMIYLHFQEALSFRSASTQLKDYASMMQTMSLGRSYDKYPKFLKTKHDIASENFRSHREKYEEEMFKNLIRPELEYAHGKFCIVHPRTTQEIKDEAVSLGHCVHSYVSDVVEGLTRILFLRKVKSKDKSLVTIEFRNNRVVQSRGKRNRSTSTEESAFITKWTNALKKKGLIPK